MIKKIFVLSVTAVFSAGLLSAAPVNRKKQLTRALHRRVHMTAAQRNEALVKAVSNPDALGQVRRLLSQGADPCRALPFAVFANNVPAVSVLFEYKNRCNWKYAVEQRLQYVMQKDRVDMFYALMADNQGITCPDPLNFTPAKHGEQWRPLSAKMLAAVNQRCFNTNTTRTAFLEEMILLNPGKNHIFSLGETYQQRIRSAQTKQGWLSNIGQLVNSNVKVSNDTLQTVIAQSRVSNVEGLHSVPFEDTLKLTRLCLRGGANGKSVLAWFENPAQEWVRTQYSGQEQMRLANVLENKPEMQKRDLGDYARAAYNRVKNWF